MCLLPNRRRLMAGAVFFRKDTMATNYKRVELLAPAGNFEKLEIAIHYGADAVYLGGKDFSLRNFSENFTLEELKQAVKLAHARGVKVYVACNIYSRNFEQEAIQTYLETVGAIAIDGIIVSDPGIIATARRLLPHIPLHLSTQANTTNYNSVLFWESQGVKRVIVARELSLDEIKEIVSHCSLEVEAFIHGAMCISYSGRCLLSNFMANRDSNRGICSHPCRWKYAVVEEKRPGKFMPLAEDDRGAYIFNSNDLCMIAHIPELIESGITAFKIEGRMKGINYVASAVKVYREAIDAYYQDPGAYQLKPEWVYALASISHRGYCTGFYFGDPDEITPNYVDTKAPIRHIFIGKVLERVGRQQVVINVRNKIYMGDIVEVVGPRGPAQKDEIRHMADENGEALPFAQPGSRVIVTLSADCRPNDLIRKVDTLS